MCLLSTKMKLFVTHKTIACLPRWNSWIFATFIFFFLTFPKSPTPGESIIWREMGNGTGKWAVYGGISGDPAPYFHKSRSLSPRRPSSLPWRPSSSLWRPSSYRMKSGFMATKTVVMEISCLSHEEKPLSDPLFNSKTTFPSPLWSRLKTVLRRFWQ